MNRAQARPQQNSYGGIGQCDKNNLEAEILA